MRQILTATAYLVSLVLFLISVWSTQLVWTVVTLVMLSGTSYMMVREIQKQTKQDI